MISRTTLDASAFSRRGVLGGAAGFGAALAGSASAIEPTTTSGRTAERGRGVSLVNTPASLVVKTRTGAVRGYFSDGIAIFKGIPYGHVAERFMPAKPPAAWTGVRYAFSYGAVCPQPIGGPGNDPGRFYTPGEVTFQDEACLNLNVWTPGAGDGQRRPVVFWIHGGGFNSGSSHESAAYDGENLSRRGDLVFVSVNHRLNALGFLNLAAFGDRYANSANAGLLDLVLALGWVRDNITAFSGDPDNVTIIGQSGGGRKVSTLLAIPAARGLFHKAILHSGSLLTVARPKETHAVAVATMAELGVEPAQIVQLATVPVAKLVAANFAACARLVTPESTVFGPPYTSPTLDGVDIPRDPFGADAPAISANLPMLVGSCLHEQASGRSHPEIVAMTEGELRAKLAKDYGARTDNVIAVFKSAHRDAPPFELLALIESVTPRRADAVRQVELKAARGGAPVFNFQFAWRTPIFDGAPLAHHGSDLAFAFANIDRCLHQTGGGPEARVLSDRMSDAWISFIRRGDPNCAGLPHWPPVTPGALPTMILDTECEVRNDHDREERQVASVVPETLRRLP